MAEQNERLAIIETKLEHIEDAVKVLSNFHVTLDAVVRENRRIGEIVDGPEAIKDRVWLEGARKNSQSLANKIRLTIAAVLTTGMLTGVWHFLLSQVSKNQ